MTATGRGRGPLLGITVTQEGGGRPWAICLGDKIPALPPALLAQGSLASVPAGSGLAPRAPDLSFSDHTHMSGTPILPVPGRSSDSKYRPAFHFEAQQPVNWTRCGKFITDLLAQRRASRAWTQFLYLHAGLLPALKPPCQPGSPAPSLLCPKLSLTHRNPCLPANL